jgi:hypothetical protein
MPDKPKQQAPPDGKPTPPAEKKSTIIRVDPRDLHIQDDILVDERGNIIPQPPDPQV